MRIKNVLNDCSHQPLRTPLTEACEMPLRHRHFIMLPNFRQFPQNAVHTAKERE